MPKFWRSVLGSGWLAPPRAGLPQMYKSVQSQVGTFNGSPADFPKFLGSPEAAATAGGAINVMSYPRRSMWGNSRSCLIPDYLAFPTALSSSVRPPTATWPNDLHQPEYPRQERNHRNSTEFDCYTSIAQNRGSVLQHPSKRSNRPSGVPRSGPLKYLRLCNTPPFEIATKNRSGRQTFEFHRRCSIIS